MTNKELNKWLHEFRGLCWHQMGVERDSRQCKCSECGKTKYALGYADLLYNPNYCSDLNLIRECEMLISKKDRVFYNENLETQIYDGDIEFDSSCNDDYFLITTATARQRAKAIYETMSKINKEH